MEETNVNTYFVSDKVAKVRWVPENHFQSDRFVTGSWDMPVNHVRLWHMKTNHYNNEENCAYLSPRCCDKKEFDGNITGLEFVDQNTVAITSSDGRLTLLNVRRAVDEDQLEEVGQSTTLHQFDIGNGISAPCTGLAVNGQDIATIGEDGRLNILNINTIHQIKRSIHADCIPLYAVAYIHQQEVLVANRMGVIRIFDVRAGSTDKPTQSFMSTCEDEKRDNFVSCMTSHPMQKHVLIAGSEEGSITVWDLRQPGFPASYLSAHNSAITDIGFHRQDPTKLFSAAEIGELWQWSQASSVVDPAEHSSTNVWLNGERAKSRLNVTALVSNLGMGLNSFDTQNSKTICGGDREAVYIIDHF